MIHPCKLFPSLENEKDTQRNPDNKKTCLFSVHSLHMLFLVRKRVNVQSESYRWSDYLRSDLVRYQPRTATAGSCRDRNVLLASNAVSHWKPLYCCGELLLPKNFPGFHINRADHVTAIAGKRHSARGGHN